MIRMIIVSNRLPVTFEYKENTLKRITSIGGLATGLNAFVEHFKQEQSGEVIWVGCPSGPEEQQHVIQNQLSSSIYKPVFLNNKLESLFVDKFCNQVLWPVFHDLSDLMYPANGTEWHSYKEANLLFYHTLAPLLQPGDLVWIHDYHLLLLPKLLRKKFPLLKIGFFLHTPFPTPEHFQSLSANIQKELLHGVLGANVIGFHIEEFKKNFSAACMHSLDSEQVLHCAKLLAAPMGIDFDFFHNRLNRKKAMSTKLKTLLSVDRLDYSKGISHKLQAYLLFLEAHPEWHYRVSLRLIVAPSRVKIKAYLFTKAEIEQSVYEINERFGGNGWLPIIYDYNIYSLERLNELYSGSDIALITPIKDGMNLVAKEFIASKSDTGVLILSKNAGAAKELTHAILVDPYNIQDISSAIKQALDMTPKQQKKNINSMQLHLRENNVSSWGNDIIHQIISDNETTFSSKPQLANKAIKHMMRARFQDAHQKLFILDYDGTLRNFTLEPSASIPSKELLNTLFKLSQITGVRIVILSGRDRFSLENMLGHLPIELVSEHGAWIKTNNIWKQLIHPVSLSWKNEVILAIKERTRHFPKAWIEEKEFSIIWHYRNISVLDSKHIAQELEIYLKPICRKHDLTLMQGKYIVDIVPSQIGKNFATKYIIKQQKYDFILSAGDDTTDEKMFSVMPDNAFSIHVGVGLSKAIFYLNNPNEMLGFLNFLM